MTPNPWSPSGLNEIETCPKSFHEQRVLRSVQGSRTEHNDWGDKVHLAFEAFFDSKGTELPGYLSIHRDYLAKLYDKPGIFWTEQKVAFDKQAKPCSWEARKEDIWGRFKIDFIKVDMEPDLGEKPIATIKDWKTGKKKDDFTQLIIYALWAFAAHPGLELCDVAFYWTQTQTETRKVYGVAEVPALWAFLIPKLVNWRDRFRNELWTPKPSGLCNGWCPVTTCEHWKPKRLGQ